MDVNSKACDICGRQKQEVNHWLVAVVRPEHEGIMFVPAEAAQDPRAEGYRYEDLCGQMCAQTRLSQWLDDLKNIDFPVKGEAPWQTYP